MIMKICTGGRMILAVDEYVYEVHMYHPSIKKLQKNHGYIIGDYVYIYHGKDKPNGMGLYKDKETGQIMIQQGNSKDKEKFSVANVIDMDIDSISMAIKEQAKKYTTEEDLEIINNSSEVFTPKIKEDDDFLKQLVKQALDEKKINLKAYKNKFSKPHTLNNIKSALVNKTKTSITNFEQWAELLGFDYEIKIFDNGTDKLNPLKCEISYKSDEGLHVKDK